MLMFIYPLRIIYMSPMCTAFVSSAKHSSIGKKYVRVPNPLLGPAKPTLRCRRQSRRVKFSRQKINFCSRQIQKAPNDLIITVSLTLQPCCQLFEHFKINIDLHGNTPIERQ